MIRILLVDDHVAFREPLAFMLNRESDFEVVGQVGTLANASRFQEPVDIAVVDLGLPDGDGVHLVHELRTRNPHASVLVLTGSNERLGTARAIQAGAAGVLHKSTSIEDLIGAIRRVNAGECLLTVTEIFELVGQLHQRSEQEREPRQRLARLTPREREVLQALADGLSDRQIGDRLSISSETVRTHMVKILSKLDVDSRLAALVFAVRHKAVIID
jgi:DNA-binding NarL/FixJ family response regulator